LYCSGYSCDPYDNHPFGLSGRLMVVIVASTSTLYLVVLQSDLIPSLFLAPGSPFCPLTLDIAYIVTVYNHIKHTVQQIRLQSQYTVVKQSHAPPRTLRHHVRQQSTNAGFGRTVRDAGHTTTTSTTTPHNQPNERYAAESKET
jgi:hypothetical protein